MAYQCVMSKGECDGCCGQRKAENGSLFSALCGESLRRGSICFDPSGARAGFGHIRRPCRSV